MMARQAVRAHRSARPPRCARLALSVLRRVFDRDPMACPHCGSRMQLRAVVLGRHATTRILEGLTVATGARAPPLSDATVASRGSPPWRTPGRPGGVCVRVGAWHPEEAARSLERGVHSRGRR